MNGKVIAIDFDGTIVDRAKYPKIGNLKPNVVESIQKLQNAGYICFLWTCRQGKELVNAIKFLEKNGINLWGYNQSPYDFTIGSNRKVVADIYIDDCDVFCDEINWNKIVERLVK